MGWGFGDVKAVFGSFQFRFTAVCERRDYVQERSKASGFAEYRYCTWSLDLSGSALCLLSPADCADAHVAHTMRTMKHLSPS